MEEATASPNANNRRDTESGGFEKRVRSRRGCVDAARVGAAGAGLSSQRRGPHESARERATKERASRLGDCNGIAGG